PASLCQSWPQRRRRPTLLVWQRTPQRVPRGQRGRSSVLPLTGADDAAIGEDRGGVVILARVARGSGGHGEDGGPVGAARGEDIGAGGAAGNGSTGGGADRIGDALPMCGVDQIKSLRLPGSGAHVIRVGAQRAQVRRGEGVAGAGEGALLLGEVAGGGLHRGHGGGPVCAVGGRPSAGRPWSISESDPGS